MKRVAVHLVCAWQILSFATQAQELGVPDYVSPGVEHRIIFSPRDPVLASLRATRAIRRVEDYGSFVLVVVDERLLGGRAGLSALGVPIRDDQAVVGINGAPLDTADRDGLATRLASIPAFLRGDELAAAAPAESSLWIIQFAGPIRDAWLERLAATGAVIVSPMATNAYVVTVKQDALPAFAAFEQNPAVQWIGAYHPFFRLAPELRGVDFGGPAVLDVTVQVIDGDSAAALLSELRSGRFPILRPEEHVLDFTNVRLTVPASVLPALASHPATFGIELLPDVRRMDEAQNQIVAGNLNGTFSGPSAPGYLAWLSSKGFSSSGQFAFSVDVTDDGVDRGSTSDVNDEFKVLGAGGASRLVYVHNYTADALGDSGNGHGNINASIVGGYNALTGAAWEDAGGYNYGLGVCPFVQLGDTKVFNNSGGGEFLAATSTRLSAAYGSGARFSTNSWGFISGNGYNSESQAHDAVVRDATGSAGNQELTIVFSAGNDGSAPNTVHPPGTAKNVITVGASENNRQTGIDGCGFGNSSANNAMDVIAFSSRGPTADGRKKPDIMAPGTHVQGAASRSLLYDGGGVCNQYWPAAQTLYCWSSGTSHACPAIAGSAALVRQYFLNQSFGTPSPAMVKAWLMASTRYMTGVGANDALWSNSQGLGLVDLGRAFDGVPRIRVDEAQVMSTTGQTYVVTGTIASSASPFRVALVWTDPPGPTTGNAWVNNLDLQVTVNGTTYLGNVFTGASSVAGGVADAKNNAEFVFLPAGTTGSFTVTVLATNIAGDGIPGNGDVTDQDFALLIYDGTTCATANITTQPANQTACVGSPATFSVVASGAGLTYQWRKNGSDIAGATAASYTIPSVVSGDAGTYDVVVTSGCSVTSNTATLTVNNPVGIFLQPTGGTQCQGTSKTFSVSAFGTAPLSYQWRKNGSNIAGALSSSYTIISLSPSDNATFDVIVTNPCGSLTSLGAVMVVNVAPSITTQPSAQSGCLGTGASFSVTAAGSAPLGYQWRKNAINIAGATAATYSIASLIAGDAATYSCVVTNGCGSATSNGAALTINSAPAVTVQPGNATVCEGAGAGFSVTATGTAPLSYQWRKNGNDIGGATSATYAIASTGPGDAATYSCVVTNGCGSATSNGATLTIDSAPAITGQPGNATVCEGALASFSVTATGTAPLAYQWRKNGNAIGGATSATYAIASTVPGDAATYSCVVTNGCGSDTSTGATLTIDSAPAITAQPASVTVCAGTPAAFSVTATGTAPLAYQWKKDGVDIPGATADTYSIASPAVRDSGAYSVAVTNACNSATSAAATLTVDAGPSIAVQPASMSACPGTPASFTVTATGTPPLTYQWKKDGIDIGGAVSATYSIPLARSGDAGIYSVAITDGCGSITSDGATLTLDDVPSITAQPAALTTCAGTPAAFAVTATGTAPLTYQWRKDGTDIGGATSPTLNLASTVAGDAGAYDVVVTNACGSVTSDAASLTIDEGPSITAQPASVTPCDGAAVGLSVAATGAAPLGYQWRKDGADIGGATAASYSIPAVTAADAGVYDVVVTNGCGSVTSDPATITIADPVTIVSQPAAQSPCSGDSFTLTVAATGTPPLSYQWRKNGTDVAGATAAALTIPAATTADAGTYAVVVTGPCGSSTSDGALVTVALPAITALAPALIAPLSPSSSPITVDVTGSCFVPSSVVYANCVALSTTFVNSTSLSCLLGPGIPQTQILGGLCVNVQNAPGDVSNSAALVVGGGNNAGTIRRHPLTPSPGGTYSLLIEGGPPFAPFSLFADLGAVTPVAGIPDPASNFVLAVSPLTGSAGPFIIVFDGVGLFGPSSGIAFDATGSFVLPGIGLPNPPLGISASLQVLYLDPSSPVGFRLNWARFPEEL